MDDAVTTTVIAAVVATAATLVVHQFQKAQAARGHNLEVTQAQTAGYTRGWFEGREQQLTELFAKTEPKDFASIR